MHNHPFPKTNDDEQALVSIGFDNRRRPSLLLYRMPTHHPEIRHFLQVDTRTACWSLIRVHERAPQSDVSLEGLWQPRDLNDVLLLIKIFETAPK